MPAVQRLPLFEGWEGWESEDPADIVRIGWRQAVIDIGSNSINLLVALADDTSLVPILSKSRFIQLALDVDRTGLLRSDRMDAAVKAIRRLRFKARASGAVKTWAVATSAVRESANGPAFVRRVREELDLEVEVLSGRREAELTFLGATMHAPPTGPTLVVDVGGGSTEFIGADSNGIRWAASLQLGSTRLTERFIWHDPPEARELAALAGYVRTYLQQLPGFRPETIILSGGTARRAASLAGAQGQMAELGVKGYGPTLRLLRERSSSDIAQMYGMRPERARILVPGTRILQAIIDFYWPARALVTTSGLREGAILASLRERASGRMA
jgi:exopolyphosphatase/guanosine-5'-triphosphate,3'-diphosphate pyrophosphatase